VGRPPQELMRGWGRTPICKAFKPDHRLEIQSTHNFVEEGKKGSGWAEEDLQRMQRQDKKSLRFKEELRDECVLVGGNG
jgi:hypothetical protein